MNFIECDSCRAKPGSHLLQRGEMNRSRIRAVINEPATKIDLEVCEELRGLYPSGIGVEQYDLAVWLIRHVMVTRETWRDIPELVNVYKERA